MVARVDNLERYVHISPRDQAAGVDFMMESSLFFLPLLVADLISPAFDLFDVDRPKPGRSIGARDCTRELYTSAGGTIS